jgi:TPR repeat protein
MRRFILFFLFALLGPARSEDADATFRSGLSAFNEGVYDRARAAWGSLAAAGDARAQTGLGFMYYSGRGVTRDSARAAQFFDCAADQGEPTAQLFLALMYFKADGVPKNIPLAAMWLELAIAGGQGDAFELRGVMMQSMSEAEREEGWRLLARWRQLHPSRGAGR